MAGVAAVGDDRQSLKQMSRSAAALTKAVAERRVAASRAQPALHALNGEIAGLVQLDIESSEGDLLHEAELRDRLAFIAADVDLAYARPTAAQYAVFAELDAKAKAGEAVLRSDIAAARRLSP